MTENTVYSEYTRRFFTCLIDICVLNEKSYFDNNLIVKTNNNYWVDSNPVDKFEFLYKNMFFNKIYTDEYEKIINSKILSVFKTFMEFTFIFQVYQDTIDDKTYDDIKSFGFDLIIINKITSFNLEELLFDIYYNFGFSSHIDSIYKLIKLVVDNNLYLNKKVRFDEINFDVIYNFVQNQKLINYHTNIQKAKELVIKNQNMNNWAYDIFFDSPTTIVTKNMMESLVISGLGVKEYFNMIGVFI